MSDLKIVDAPDPDEDLIRNLRLDPAHTDAAVRIPIMLKCRKPGRQEFIRVHNTIELNVRAIVLQEDGDF
jgi:preprotein translocase subunit Sss1